MNCQSINVFDKYFFVVNSNYFIFRKIASQKNTPRKLETFWGQFSNNQFYFLQIGLI